MIRATEQVKVGTKMKSLLKVFSLVALFIGMILMPAHAEVPKAELPLIITSCGQSPDALMIKLLADQIRLDSVFEKTLEPDQVEGFKTLIIGIGEVSKGLARQELIPMKKLAE